MNVVHADERRDYTNSAGLDGSCGRLPGEGAKATRADLRLTLAQGAGFWILVASVAAMAFVSVTEFMLLVLP